MKHSIENRNATDFGITFETKCYENDWEYLLKTNYLDLMISRCNVNFEFKQLIINNVENPEIVKKYAQKKIDKGIIDAFYVVDDYIDEALQFFDINKESFGKGYNYSSSELVGLYLSKTKYHLHFSSDAFLPKLSKSDWIKEACQILDMNSEYVVANPCWDYEFETAIGQSVKSNFGNFIVGYGFSDQCYLVRSADFRAQIYNFKHPDSERYPKYGGELFEKRVDSFMRTNQLFRLTHSKESYVHRNFPKSLILRKIMLIMIRLNLYLFVRNLKIQLFNVLNNDLQMRR
jgi:hypothetical protein